MSSRQVWSGLCCQLEFWKLEWAWQSRLWFSQFYNTRYDNKRAGDCAVLLFSVFFFQPFSGGNLSPHPQIWNFPPKRTSLTLINWVNPLDFTPKQVTSPLFPSKIKSLEETLLLLRSKWVLQLQHQDPYSIPLPFMPNIWYNCIYLLRTLRCILGFHLCIKPVT